MMKRLLLLAFAATTVLAQGPGGPANREAPVTPVPFERILRSNQEPQNWLTYSGNLNSQRHTGLTQISPENAADLTLKWVFQSRSLDKHEVTPLVVDGVMYTIQSPNDVIALDAATGKTIWQYLHKPAEGTRNPCCGNLTRGVAILGDKLFLAGLDAKMIALDAKTGKELWNVQVSDYKQQYAMTVAPLVIKDKVITGVAGGEHGVRGFLAAYDVNTGKEVWRFNTVPGPGEPGYETWLGKDGKPNDSYLHGGFYMLDRTNGRFFSATSFIKTNWLTGFDEKGRPTRAPGILPTAEGTLVYPGNQGGTNWYNPSFSPATGLFYIPAWENSSSIYRKGEDPPEFEDGKSFTGTGPGRTNATDDVFSSIIAMDPKTRQRKWTFRMAAPSTEGGVLTTASNVLFAGGRNGQFIALDARDGKLLWETNLGPSVSAGPMSYMVNGKQYVSVQCGTSLYTFALR